MQMGPAHLKAHLGGVCLQWRCRWDWRPFAQTLLCSPQLVVWVRQTGWTTASCNTRIMLREKLYLYLFTIVFSYLHILNVFIIAQISDMIIIDGKIHQLLSSSSCAWIYWFQASVTHGSIDGDTHGQGRNTILLWKLLTNKTKFPLDQAVEHRWFFVKKIRKIISINLFEI